MNLGKSFLCLWLADLPRIRPPELIELDSRPIERIASSFSCEYVFLLSLLLRFYFVIEIKIRIKNENRRTFRIMISILLNDGHMSGICPHSAVICLT